jgi:hypothetical protein
VLAFAAIGGAAALRDRRDGLGRLCLLAIACWLVLFSTRVPVYDGERLFLPVFPLMAILAGRGMRIGLQQARRVPLPSLAVAVIVLIEVGLAVRFHPFELSYYSLAAGGLRGAARAGQEVTYWGDAVDGRLLRELERRITPGETVALVPTLAPLQGAASTTLALARRDVVIGDQQARSGADWWIVSMRRAYLPEDVQAVVEATPPVATREVEGVVLSGLWRNPGAKRRGPN